MWSWLVWWRRKKTPPESRQLPPASPVIELPPVQDQTPAEPTPLEAVIELSPETALVKSEAAPAQASQAQLSEYQLQRASYFTSMYSGNAVPRSDDPRYAYRARILPAVPTRALPAAVVVPTPAEQPVANPSRPMEFFASVATTSPASPPPSLVRALDPILATIYFTEREDAEIVPSEASRAYLSSPELAEAGTRLRDAVLQNWQSRRAPLSVESFYSLSLEICHDPAEALLLCHNVAKAFARGGQAIRWQNINRALGQYSDGSRVYTASPSHSAAMLKAPGASYPTIFYALFLASEFGTRDPGDWYRFFSHATICAFAVRGLIVHPVDPPNPECEALAASVDAVCSALRDSAVPLSPAWQAWLWSNSLSFVEAARGGSIPAVITETERVDLRGATFGAAKSGSHFDPVWRWYVPVMTVRPEDAPLASASPELFQAAGSASHQPHLTESTVAAVLNSGSPHLRTRQNEVSFSLIATIEEGVACRFGSGAWNDPALADLTPAIVDQLGWKILDRAVRRQAVIRGVVPGRDPAQARCEYDRGFGFSTLPVIASEEQA